MSAPARAPEAALPSTRPAVFRGRARGRVVLLLCAFYAISYLDRVNISTAGPVMRDDLGLSDTQWGLVLGAFSIPYAFFQVFGGWFGDRWGARRTLVLLSAVWAVATVMTGLAGGLVTLFAARLLLGLGESAGFPTATSAMSRWLPGQLRGQGQGLTHAASRLATALAPLLVAGLITLTDWRWSFVLVGLLSLVWAAVWWWQYRDDPREHPRVGADELAELAEGQAARARAGRTPWRLIAPALLPVAFVDFCYGWLLWVYLTWLPTVFEDGYGLQLEQFALFTTLVLLAGVVGDLVGGRTADALATRGRSLAWARRLPLVVGLGGSLVALLPALLGGGSLVVVTVSLAAAFFLLETTNSTLWALPMDIAPEHAGAASGFMNTGYGVAGVLSPIAFGAWLDATGDWRQPMTAAVVLLAAGALVALRVDPRRRTPA